MNEGQEQAAVNSDGANAANGQLTLGDLQMIIGAKEIELRRLHSQAEAIIERLRAENAALKAECERLRAPSAPPASEV